MNSRAAARRATAAAPITTPAMPPPESPELLWDDEAAADVVAAAVGMVDVELDGGDGVAVGAAEEVLEKGFVSSEGHASPGCSMNVEFFANWV
jgi:hypothetical protein